LFVAFDQFSVLPNHFHLKIFIMTNIKTILKTFFGYDEFRPLQEEIIRTLLNKQSCLVLMPTGGGKSICYQVPAIALEGTALVISPLIALMKDQVESLQANGVKAAFLNSSLSNEKENEVLNACLNGELKLLYVSPERALTIAQGLLASMKISMIAIDEAHCISQWGHDFRPEYTRIKELKSHFPDIPIIALTATADKTTRKDILSQLNLEAAATFISSFDRPNIRLDVMHGLKKKDKMKEIINFIHKRKGESGIIYCLSRKSTEEVSSMLNSNGIESAFYHAGMDAESRNKVQEAFIRDDSKIICATVAFGMGIDKSNIRWVIHYNLPAKIEGYYQEIGRAGRDGLKSDALLMYNIGDLMLLTRFAEESGQRELNKEKLLRMQQFAEARICRRRILLSYFGETMFANCNNCDVCSYPPPVTDGTLSAQKALSAIVRTGESVGITMLIQILRGSQNAELLEKGFHNIKTYGTGKEHSFESWQAFVLQYLQLGLIEIAYDDSFKLKLTSTGHSVLRGDTKVEIAEIKPFTHHEFDEFDEMESEINGALNSNNLFEQLRQLRKKIASAEGLPPYVIFTDKTLKEMCTQLPYTREEMLAIQGVSQNKMDKYGKEFIDLIRQFCSLPSLTYDEDFKQHVSDEKLQTYLQLMEQKQMHISSSALSKILIGTENVINNPLASTLPFYGIIKNKIKYTALNPILKEFFERNKLVKFKQAADYYFGAEKFNHLSPTTSAGIKKSILGLPQNRPNNTIDNFHILESRKMFGRSYEHWNEPEISLFKSVVAQTNDLDFIADIFQRSPDSIKAYYKKNFMAPDLKMVDSKW
jgi:ATP-dependent DNA helicase RecQ